MPRTKLTPAPNKWAMMLQSRWGKASHELYTLGLLADRARYAKEWDQELARKVCEALRYEMGRVISQFESGSKRPTLMHIGAAVGLAAMLSTAACAPEVSFDQAAHACLRMTMKTGYNECAPMLDALHQVDEDYRAARMQDTLDSISTELEWR